ncbi:hypothetical protein D3C83_138240 [compost metagenome]
MSAPAASGAQPAFRIQQEHTGGDNALPFGEPRTNLDAVGQLDAERDCSRLVPVTRRDEYVLLHAGVNDRVTRHRDD